MDAIPKEVQELIKQKIPKFVRLSKHDYVGKECFIKQCYLPITKQECAKYINNYNIGSFIIFSHSAYKGIYIDIFTLTDIYNK